MLFFNVKHLKNKPSQALICEDFIQKMYDVSGIDRMSRMLEYRLTPRARKLLNKILSSNEKETTA